MTKAATQARAEMVAKVRAAREAMPEPITCAAAYYDPVRRLAEELAREALTRVPRFGSSKSCRDSWHVAGLVLSDAYRAWWKEAYP